jgi:hypothetical protein
LKQYVLRAHLDVLASNPRFRWGTNLFSSKKRSSIESRLRFMVGYRALPFCQQINKYCPKRSLSAFRNGLHLRKELRAIRLASYFLFCCVVHLLHASNLLIKVLLYFILIKISWHTRFLSKQ